MAMAIMHMSVQWEPLKRPGGELRDNITCHTIKCVQMVCDYLAGEKIPDRDKPSDCHLFYPIIMCCICQLSLLLLRLCVKSA